VMVKRVAAGGRSIGRVIGAFHPALGLGVRLAGYGATAYGNSKLNEGFAINRVQEAEADSFAFNLGLASPLASSLVRFERCGVGSAPLPEWAHALLAFGHLNVSDHPSTAERVNAALGVPGSGRRACRFCWEFVQNGSSCTCGKASSTTSCSCGNQLDPDDRFCGRCGRTASSTRCRLCGTTDDGGPFCGVCRFPLP
jgi:hypothetical protein